MGRYCCPCFCCFILFFLRSLHSTCLTFFLSLLSLSRSISIAHTYLMLPYNNLWLRWFFSRFNIYEILTNTTATTFKKGKPVCFTRWTCTYSIGPIHTMYVAHYLLLLEKEPAATQLVKKKQCKKDSQSDTFVYYIAFPVLPNRKRYDDAGAMAKRVAQEWWWRWFKLLYYMHYMCVWSTKNVEKVYEKRAYTRGKKWMCWSIYLIFIECRAVHFGR